MALRAACSRINKPGNTPNPNVHSIHTAIRTALHAAIHAAIHAVNKKENALIMAAMTTVSFAAAAVVTFELED